MAVSLGPNLIEDGLVLSLDAGDINSVMGATVEVLVVAGGGGGGMDMGGGGGGGGVIYNSSYAVTQGTAVTVTVGNGGTGAPAAGTNGQPGGHQYTISATQGGNSVFGSITATGGGYGGSSYFQYGPNNGYGGSGGSGGGASGYSDTSTGRAGTGTSGQGFNGGGSSGQYYSGGGGGAGGVGVSGPNIPNGGSGVLYSTMSPYYFAGGGGGGGYSINGGNGGVGGGGGGAVGITTGGAGLNNGAAGGGGSTGGNPCTPGGNGGANTGGGGGGGSHYNANNKGGDGGSGIVIVRYSGPQKATGGTISTVAGYTIHTFTSSGTFTPYLNWYDSSGNNKTFGLDSSGITWNSGGYFTLANGAAILSSNAITTSTTCTVVIWIKTTDTQALTFRGNDNNYYLAAYTPANAFYSGSCGSPTYWIDTLSVANPNPTYLDGNWHMWEMKNVNFSAWTTFEFNRYSGYTFGNGAVSKIMIYNRNLSSDESLQIYNATKSRHLV